MTTTESVLDPGRQIAIAYWRATPHVWSNGYPDKEHCALCQEADKDAHKAQTPQGPFPTVVMVTDRVRNFVVAKALDVYPPEGYASSGSYTELTIGGRGPFSFGVYLSCGHGPIGMATTPENVPGVGDSYDCMSCHGDWHDQNWPCLPEEIRERIDAEIPHCPECGGIIARINFKQETVHTFYIEADAQTGEISGSSQHHDVLYEDPAWLGRETYAPGPGSWRTGEIEVACENRHDWTTTRLAYAHNGSEHMWRVLPA